MGLITKEVEIKVTGYYVKFLRDNGYELPTIKTHNGNIVPKNTKMKIPVSLLSHGSGAIVEVECDCCKKILTRRYYQYTSGNHDGKYYCNSCNSKMLLGRDNSPKWNPNKTDEERQNGRTYQEYHDFIRKVLYRDNYTCYCCGSKDKSKLEVHHLNGYNWFIEGRHDETNGITLCSNCHKNFHNKYGSGNNTKEQFEEWINISSLKLEKCDYLLPTKQVYCLDDDIIYNSANELARFLKVNPSIVYSTCNRTTKITKNGNEELCNKSIKKKHYVWYDDYLKMTDKDIVDYLERCKSSLERKVICLTTNKIFNTLSEASKYYNIVSSSDVLYCAKGKFKHAGKLSDGTKLQWMFYEDYLRNTSSQEEGVFIMHKNNEGSEDYSKN